MIYQPSITLIQRNGQPGLKVAIRPQTRQRPAALSERYGFPVACIVLFCLLAFVAPLMMQGVR